MDFKLNLEKAIGGFMLPTEIADSHLKLAGALQLRVILYCYRNMKTPIDIKAASSFLNASEEDIKDALMFWSELGILVCDKEYAEDIKKSVENLTPRTMYEEKRWGTYRVLDDTIYTDGNHALTRSITVKAGKSISYHIHHHRTKTWTFTQGEGIFVLNGEELRVKAGDTVNIHVEHYHAIKALSELTFIEVQCNPLVEEDIEKFEWNGKVYPEFIEGE